MIALKESPSHERILQELVMDILRVLASPDIEVRKKTLQLSYELVTSKTINEMVLVLKKEVSKTHNTQESEDVEKYKQSLVRTLHQCTMKFPDVANAIIPGIYSLFNLPMLTFKLTCHDDFVFFKFLLNFWATKMN